MAHETCHLKELGGYSLLQCKPCLVKDLLCVAVGETIRVYSVLSGHLVLVLNGHSGIVTSLSVHPHKPYQLISASMDGTIKIWAVDDGVLMKNISMGSVHIYGLKATSKAIHLIYGKQNSKNQMVGYGRIGFPNEDEKDATREIEGLLSECLILDSFRDVQATKFSADKKWCLNAKATRAAFLFGNHILVFHIKTRKSRKIHLSEKLGDAISIDYNPREESILTTHSSGQIRVFTNFIKTDENIGSWRDHWHSNDQIEMHATFSNDGNTIISGGQEAVLVYNKWNGEEDKRRNFIPRLHSPIIWVVSTGEYTFVSMASNCIQIVHHSQLSKMITSLTKSITGYYGAGVTYDNVSNCVVTNGRPGTIQFYNLATDQCTAAVDVTKENVIIATGSMSNAANVTKVEIKGNRMVTVDRMDDGVTRPRDIVRVWSRDTKSGSNVEWIEDVYIERAHISAVTDIKIIDESTFVTSGADSKLKRWIIENGDLRNSHVGNYRDDPILNFDISEDGTTVTTCDESKCSIFSAYDMSYQNVTLPTLEEGQQIEKVFHGRGNSSHLLVVKHSQGFFIWDLCTCACVKSVKVDCSKSTFEMFRSDSDDLFGLVEEKNLKSKISIFNLTDVLPMVIVDTEHLVKSLCFSKPTEERKTGVKVLNSNKICVLNNYGSLLEIVSDSDMVASRESSKPMIKLSRKNMKTPVGGLLSALITPSETDSKEQLKEKIKINNQQLSDLLYLPAYMMPNSNEYCSQIISTLMCRPDLVQDTNSSGSKKGQENESGDVEMMEMETDEGSIIQKSTKTEEDFVLDKTSYESLKNAFDSVCLS